MEFELYTDNAGYFRWRLQAANNRIIADSAESFSSHESALASIGLVRAYAPNAQVNDRTRTRSRYGL